MFCTSCGTANPESGRFCVACGAGLASQMAPVAVPGAPPMAYVGGMLQPLGKPSENSGKAIASLICGCIFFVFPASVAAIILGHMALSEIEKAAGRLKGRGLAVAGLVLGYGGVLFIPFIIVLVAAIAIPNLLRSRMAANEASAVGSLRVMNTAAIVYATRYGNGFPPNVDVLSAPESGGATCDHAQLLDGALASGHKNGYTFVYFLEPGPSGAPTLSPVATDKGCTMPGGSAFEIHADPMTRGTSGQRSFYIDQTGVIRSEMEKPATADSNALE